MNKRMLVVLLAVVCLAFAMPAMAGNQSADDNFMSSVNQQTANGHGINVNGDYNEGTTINGGIKNTNKNTAIANGGNAFAAGGSVIGSGNSTNFNTNKQSQSQNQFNNQTTVAGNNNGNNNGNFNGNNNGNNNGNFNGNNSNNADLEVNQNFEAKRDFSGVAGSAYTANGPDYRDQSTKTGNVQDAATILQVRKTFTLRMLKALEAGEELHVIVKAYQSMREQLGYPESGYKGMPLDKEITIILEVPTDMSQYTDIAHLTVIGEEETTTMGAIAAAAVEAMRQGADTLVVTGEGAKKIMEAGGWGIMLGGSGSVIAGDAGSNAASAVIAPGIGYAKAKTYYGYCPWIQAFGLATK